MKVEYSNFADIGFTLCFCMKGLMLRIEFYKEIKISDRETSVLMESKDIFV